MKKQTDPQKNIPKTIGKTVPLCKRLTKAETPAPVIIWINPINADALPALYVNGAKAKAVQLGTNNPSESKKVKIMAIKMLGESRSNPNKENIKTEIPSNTKLAKVIT